MSGEQGNRCHEIIHMQAKSRHVDIYEAKMTVTWGWGVAVSGKV